MFTYYLEKSGRKPYICDWIKCAKAVSRLTAILLPDCLITYILSVANIQTIFIPPYDWCGFVRIIILF